MSTIPNAADKSSSSSVAAVSGVETKSTPTIATPSTSTSTSTGTTAGTTPIGIIAFTDKEVSVITTTSVNKFPFPSAREFCAATRIDHDNYIITGGCVNDENVATVQQYSHSTREWKSLPSMVKARSDHRSVTLANPLRIMVLGNSHTIDYLCCVYPVCDMISMCNRLI
jgi:hypothetical protein